MKRSAVIGTITAASTASLSKRPTRGLTGGLVLVGLGIVGLVLGAFMPFVTMTAPIIGTQTKSLMQGGDGWFVLLFGAALAAPTYLSWAQGVPP